MKAGLFLLCCLFLLVSPYSSVAEQLTVVVNCNQRVARSILAVELKRKKETKGKDLKLEKNKTCLTLWRSGYRD